MDDDAVALLKESYRQATATRRVMLLVAASLLHEGSALSPDDRLLAYASEESGRREIYVQALDGERGRWQLSNERGRRPRWRADGGGGTPVTLVTGWTQRMEKP